MNRGLHYSLDPELVDVYRIEAEDHLASIGDALVELHGDPTNAAAFGDVRRRLHTLKGAAAAVGMAAAANLAHRLEDLMEHIHATGTCITADSLDLVSVGAHVLQRISREIDEESQMAQLRDLHERIDAVLSSEATREDIRDGKRALAHTVAPPALPERTLPQVLRVSRSHLESLTRMVDELSLHRNGFDRRQRQLVARMQSTLSVMRMLPLCMLAPRLHRIVRVTAQQENKKAALVFLGEDINVDTAVVEQIVDPLMHLLRNAVGHGIELPEVRKALGKPEHGTIEIRARTGEHEIVVDVEDDGAGFNFPAIREQAVARGLLSPNQAQSIGQAELCRIVLFPGFSTARTVSQVSGRGVGLDVVQEGLRSLRGSLDIHSVAGRRTVVTLRIPIPSSSKDQTNPTDAGWSPEPAVSIMIVDDSPSMRRINASLIRKAGWSVVTAMDGLDALDKLQRSPHRPDAIVLDVEMPRMDGLGLLTNLRKRKEYDDIPVILLTSRESEHLRRKGEELGVSVYLVKPCYGEVLINHLRRLTT